MLRVCMLEPGWNTYTEQKAKPGGTQAITSKWPPIAGIETSVFFTSYFFKKMSAQMVPNGPFLEKWTMLILGSAVHHKSGLVFWTWPYRNP